MYQICVSGASKGQSSVEGQELAEATGKVIAKAKHTLLTGATVGIPYFAAVGYKKAGGLMSVGLSPATSRVEHVVKYRLPTEPFDTIIFTGLHYVGRDALLINSADAVVSIGGRMGTLHELTIAIETETPIGFLQGAGGVGTEVSDILHAAGRRRSQNVVFGEKPEEVLGLLVAILNRQYKAYAHVYA